jgi:hypothetical protein
MTGSRSGPEPTANPPADRESSQSEQQRAIEAREILHMQVIERRILRPHARLGEAFRLVGLDEHMLAAHYMHVLDEIMIKPNGKEAIDKVVVDFLKECRSVLDPPRAAGSNPPTDGAPVTVTLVHSVDRPVRPGFQSQQDLCAPPDDPLAGAPAF